MNAKEEATDATKRTSTDVKEELPGLTPAVSHMAAMMPKSPSVKRDMNRFPEKVRTCFALILA